MSYPEEYGTIPPTDGFNSLMNQAQDLHGRGQFRQAQLLWRGAELVAPSVVEAGRAVRGDAASSERLNDIGYATDRAKQAYNMHTAAWHNSSGDQALPIRRERAASAAVVGKIMLGPIIKRERAGMLTPFEARIQASPALRYMQTGLTDILEIGQQIGGVDQYKINMVSRYAVASSLYGDQTAALMFSHEARELGWRSEAKDSPTAANISTMYRLLARGRSIPRGYAAVLINKLATPTKSPRRSLALSLAANKFVGL